MRLQGQRAIVTGGGSGIGAAIVETFAKEGARVVAVDLDATAGQSLVEKVRHQGQEARFVQGDVSDAAYPQACDTGAQGAGCQADSTTAW